MEKSEVYTQLIEKLNADLVFYSEMIREVALEMISESFTEYPIFIASQHEIKIGTKILDHLELARDYSISATTLEELVTNRIIQENKKEEFIKAFGNADTQMCVLFIRPDGAEFVFRKYASNK